MTSAKLDALLEETNGLTESVDRITKELKKMGFRMRKPEVNDSDQVNNWMETRRSRPNISERLGEEKILYPYGVPTRTNRDRLIWKILYEE